MSVCIVTPLTFITTCLNKSVLEYSSSFNFIFSRLTRILNTFSIFISTSSTTGFDIPTIYKLFSTNDALFPFSARFSKTLQATKYIALLNLHRPSINRSTTNFAGAVRLARHRGSPHETVYYLILPYQNVRVNSGRG